MTAEDIKVELYYYYLYKRQFLLVTTEQQLDLGYIMDVWVMDKNYMGIEIEIKVSRSDLMGELNTINRIQLSKVHPTLYPEYQGGCKYRKHKLYLSGTYKTATALPNRFYFAVPEELKELALKGIKNTPYGLLVVQKSEYRGAMNTTVIKSAKLIHKGVVGQKIINQTMRRLAGENYDYKLNRLLTNKQK